MSWSNYWLTSCRLFVPLPAHVEKSFGLNALKRTRKVRVLCLEFVLNMRSHERMFLTGPSPFGMNGIIVVCFYLDHILKVAAVSDTLCLLVQDGEIRPKKKKKLMKKKTKRRGEDIQMKRIHLFPAIYNKTLFLTLLFNCPTTHLSLMSAFSVTHGLIMMLHHFSELFSSNQMFRKYECCFCFHIVLGVILVTNSTLLKNGIRQWSLL